MNLPTEFKQAYLNLYLKGFRQPQPFLAYVYQLLSRRFRPGHEGYSVMKICELFRRSVEQDFGKLAQPVLQNWGINHYKQLGHAIFALAEQGYLRLQENDSMEDFVKAGNIDLEKV